MAATKSIEAELLRVSANGKYIEFIINCPTDYKFTTFEIKVLDEDQVYSIAENLFYDESGLYITTTNNRFTGTVEISSLGVTEPKIFQINLAAKHNTLAEHTTEEWAAELEAYPCGVSDVIEYLAYISDVSHVYTCLAKDVSKLGTECMDSNLLNDVIRNYLILYAHKEAMNLDYIDEAQKWFKLTKNCFKACKTNTCGEPCNCGCHS